MSALGIAGLLAPIAVWGYPSPVRTAVGWGGAAVGAWILAAARRQWRMQDGGYRREVPLGVSEAAHVSGSAVPELPPTLYEHGKLHPEVRRILDIAASQFRDRLVLDPAQVEFEEDGRGGRKLVLWGFHCVDSGFLTTAGIQDRLQSTFRKGLGGVWAFEWDETGDRFLASRKSRIERLVFPPDWPVVTDAAAAKRLYIGWEFKVGKSARGVEGVCPQKMPHLMCIGESGSGKSVSVRSLLEQFRAAGWQLILADGKGPDYAGYFAPHPEDNNLPVPGTVAVGIGASPRGMSYVGAIVLAYLILQERQNGSMEAKITDPEGWNNFAPVLLVMDEIKGMREKWKSALPGKDFEAIESMVTEILSLGRELRVHVLLVSQDARAVSIPNTWKSNVPMSICLGRPKELTLKYGFPESVQPKVRLITDAMDPKIKGRCVIASVDEKTGASDATEYQGYLGYSPGESWDNANLPPQVKDHWPSFKQNVSDKVPRMYTRQWFKIEEKSEAQLTAEEKSGDRGYIDFEMFTVDELKKMHRVALDKRGSDGRIIPDPAVTKFDPASPHYVCRPPRDDANRVVAEL